MDGKLPRKFRPLPIDWDQLGYPDSRNRQESNLTYPIHVMFEKRPSNRIGFTGSNAEYSKIEPAIRLASAFLSTPASQRFVYSMVYECKRLPSQFDFEGEPCYQFRQTTETDSAKIEHRARQIWYETSLYTEFGPMTDEEQDEEQYRVGAFTDCDDVPKPGITENMTALDDKKILDRFIRIAPFPRLFRKHRGPRMVTNRP